MIRRIAQGFLAVLVILLVIAEVQRFEEAEAAAQARQLYGARGGF